MKTFPVVPVGCGDMHNIWLRLQTRQIMDKTKGLVAIIPKQEEKTTEELISYFIEHSNGKFLTNEETMEKLIQDNKELFNSKS